MSASSPGLNPNPIVAISLPEFIVPYLGRVISIEDGIAMVVSDMLETTLVIPVHIFESAKREATLEETSLYERHEYMLRNDMSFRHSAQEGVIN